MTIDWNLMLSCGIISTGRSLSCTAFTHPVDLIKVRIQQSHANGRPLKVRQAVREVSREAGWRGFYQGLSTELVRLSTKEWWRWPMVVYLPTYLQREWSLSSVQSQIVSAGAISAVDSAVYSPIERRKVKRMLSRKSISEPIWRNGWIGMVPLFSRSFVGWGAFCVSQQVLRDRYREISKKEKLLLIDQGVIGVGVSVIVRGCMGPLDMLSNRVNGSDQKLQQVLASISRLSTPDKFVYLWRGTLLGTLAISIHNIASIWLIESFSITERQS